MYVAMTRAKRHLFLTSKVDRSSPFFENLEIEPIEVAPEPKETVFKETKAKKLEVSKPSYKTPLKRSISSLGDSKVEGGKGKEFGKEVHQFAERYASGEDLEPENEDEEEVKKFLDNLGGKLLTEETCFLPLEVEDRRIVLKGRIDLIHLKGGIVEVIDYKTDREMTNLEEYRKQLSAYYHAVNEVFKDKKVTPKIFYTSDGKVKEIEPLSKRELGNCI